MAWNSPMTALDNQVLTAGQYNAYIRDNLNAQAVAKATMAGQHFAVTAIHSIAARHVASARVATAETTSSVTYADLATVGPTVTVETGENCIVWLCTRLGNNTLNSQVSASVTMSGADSESASDAADYWRVVSDGKTANVQNGYCVARRYNNLTPGVHTFTVKYRVGSGSTSATFADREIIALPI